MKQAEIDAGGVGEAMVTPLRKRRSPVSFTSATRG